MTAKTYLQISEKFASVNNEVIEVFCHLVHDKKQI